MTETEDVVVPAGDVSLPGLLHTSPDHVGIVVFAHGSGSSRHSPRNAAVARHLHSLGLGTLLFDLLSPPEAADRANVFDIALLAERLIAARSWLEGTSSPPAVGYFGASTGAAAALVAAADPGQPVDAVVSRGGRPDLAGDHLRNVRAPTLLIVGERDRAVLGMNEEAAARIAGRCELVIVPGATHLFEEPGALEQVAAHAGAWFFEHLTRQEEG